MDTQKKPDGTPSPVDIPEDDFDEYLEWTQEEETAFLKIINETIIDDLDSTKT